MSKLNQYKRLKKIGEGCFGEVFLVQRINTKEIYVQKKIELFELDKTEIGKYLMRERTIMGKLKHKNVVRLYEYFEENNSAYFIMEYCNGGSLDKHLEAYKKKYKNPFPLKLIQIFARQIVEGLAYIHSRGVIHRDLKLDNILLNFKTNQFYDYREAEIKIIDFGLSSFGAATSLVGSPMYMDPKILEKYDKAGGEDKLNQYNEKADIWSLGAICYEMLTGESLFKADNVSDLVNEEGKGFYYLPLKYSITAELISFLNAMLQYDPQKRASAKQLLQYPFLTKEIHKFTQSDLSQIAYKIKDGKLTLNFIFNKTINLLFNPKITQINNTFEIKISEDHSHKTKFNGITKRELIELLDNYKKARNYFNKCQLITQEEDAKQKIEIIIKMQRKLELGQYIDKKEKPKTIKPEYIYGCSTKERNEIFLLIIKAYKQKRENEKHLDIKSKKNLDYNILSLENAYKNIWAPPPKYRYENIIPMKIEVKRLDNLVNIECTFIISLVLNLNKLLKKEVLLKADNNSINSWIWQIDENDWNNIFKNKPSLHFDLEMGLKEKKMKFKLDVGKEKLGKPAAFIITQPISNNQKIIINFLLTLIASGNNKKLICEKIYLPFEYGNFLSKSSKY